MYKLTEKAKADGWRLLDRKNRPQLDDKVPVELIIEARGDCAVGYYKLLDHTIYDHEYDEINFSLYDIDDDEYKVVAYRELCTGVDELIFDEEGGD